MASFERRPRRFVRGFGTLLTDAEGHRTFDAVSSIWTTIHGHGHPHIVAAIARQAAELDHATALGASNPPAEELAERLGALAGLPYAFFASDGASAVEAALKMALQYWRNTGEPGRTRFAHLRSSYHGDTVGAMSVSDIALFRDRFSSLCFEAIPYDRLDETIRRPDLAAIVVEPIVQAAAGIRLVSPETYQPLLAPRGPLLIVDEIATGFGRTGTLFAHEQLDLTPDLLCLGKGISGGALALSATLASARIHDAFLSPSPADARHFFHGHSYAANPIACAAGLASLDLFEHERTLEHVRALTAHLATLLAPMRRDPRVRELRQAGLMCGIELATEHLAARTDAPTIAWSVADAMYERGHFTRPIGDTIQLVPPLNSTAQELDAFIEALSASLDERST